MSIASEAAVQAMTLVRTAIANAANSARLARQSGDRSWRRLLAAGPLPSRREAATCTSAFSKFTS
jgi:hypothetical protein